MKTYRIDWYEHKTIESLNDWVESTFNKDTRDDYYQLNGINFLDFKYVVTEWIESQKDILNDLIEIVDGLPDDEYQEYDVDDQDNHIGVKEE